MHSLRYLVLRAKLPALVPCNQDFSIPEAAPGER